MVEASWIFMAEASRTLMVSLVCHAHTVHPMLDLAMPFRF